MTDRHPSHLPVGEDEKIVTALSLGDVANRILATLDQSIHHPGDGTFINYPCQ